MKIIAAKCPRCDADINIDKDSKITKCEYCNTSIIIEDDKLEIQKDENNNASEKELKNNFNYIGLKTKNYKINSNGKKKHYKFYLLLFAIVLLIVFVIAIKITWDYKNTFGSILFLIFGLLYLLAIKESGFKERNLFIDNIIGLVLFFLSLGVSLFLYNLLPGYVNKWESNNIKLSIGREEATVEFKDTGIKETIKYSSYPTYQKNKIVNNELKNYTVIKISNYHFVYSADDKMCYADENDECIEELKLVKE